MTVSRDTALADARGAVLSRFPLSRVSEAFHDDMLGVLPPVHVRGMPGFVVSEAVSEDVHAQFVQHGKRFYGAYVALRDPSTWITIGSIAVYEAANPDAAELAWYPYKAEGSAS